MIVRSYADRSPLAATSVYCDTSFILDFFAHSRRLSAPISSPMHAARAKAAFEFYIWARGQSVDFVTSALAVQECYHKVLFTPIRSAAGGLLWKDFRGARPAGFATALATGRAALRAFHTFLVSSGIRLVGVDARAGANDQRIVGYARAILTKYELDTMDAFQYAVMRRRRVAAVATSDGDWDQLPYGVVIRL